MAADAPDVPTTPRTLHVCLAVAMVAVAVALASAVLEGGRGPDILGGSVSSREAGAAVRQADLERRRIDRAVPRLERREVVLKGGWRGTAELFLEDGGLRLARSTFSGGMRENYYFRAGALVLVERWIGRTNSAPGEPHRTLVERFYFGEAGLVHWLDFAGDPVPRIDPSFEIANWMLSDRAGELAEAARTGAREVRQRSRPAEAPEPRSGP